MKYILVFLILFTTLYCKKPNNGNLPETIHTATSSIPFKNYLGVNLFEWDFVEPNLQQIISERKIHLVKGFGGIRHYLDWEKIEPTEGKFTFNPSHSGSWHYDSMYERTQKENVDILVCLKTIPPWLMNTYPEGERDYENVPAPYGTNRSDPASYILQAKAGFQFAARYGSNTNIGQSLISLNTSSRWPGDEANVIKIGLGMIKYIECDNERDKWWKGSKAEQSAEEYAANLSAFYDGHKGKLGNNVGVKTADPSMKVVMAGLSIPDPSYVARMIEWCRKNRGFKADGSIDLCFDVINYHIYPNDTDHTKTSKATVGVAPELTSIGRIADDFLRMSKAQTKNMEVWVTETGYDVAAGSIQRAIPIGNKSSFITQADWNLRTALLYARHRINKSVFYMLDDVNLNSNVQFSSSGFVNADYSPRPSWYYMQQAKSLLGDYSYDQTLNSDPLVDLYKLKDKEIYVLTIPDQVGRTGKYTLDLGKSKQAIIHTLQQDKEKMSSTTVATLQGKLEISVTETPIFVEKL
jgi:Beta-galactosidase